jgi:membrane protease YdiL (CAAX protease family)
MIITAVFIYPNLILYGPYHVLTHWMGKPDWKEPLFVPGTIFGAGFVEETAFSGYILTRLAPKGKLNWKKIILPLIITYFLHAAWHWPFGFTNPIYWTLHNSFYSFIFGIFGGIVMLKTKNLAGPIAFHIFTDLI